MRPVCLLGISLVLAGLALSTSPSAQQATFRAGTRTVPVYATVTDANGRLVELQRTDELNSTFTRVAQELHSQYLLGFSPQTLDGKTHELEVRVTQPGLVARARKSYIAK